MPLSYFGTNFPNYFLENVEALSIFFLLLYIYLLLFVKKTGDFIAVEQIWFMNMKVIFTLLDTGMMSDRINFHFNRDVKVTFI